MANSKNDIQGFVRELIPSIEAFRTWVTLQLAEDNRILIESGNAKTLRVMHSVAKFASLMQRYEPYLAMFPGEHLAEASVALWFASLSAMAHGLPHTNPQMQLAVRALNAILERERSTLSATDLYIRWNTFPMWFLGTTGEKKLITEARLALEKVKAALKNAVSEQSQAAQQTSAKKALADIMRADTALQAGLKREGLDRFLAPYRENNKRSRPSLAMLPMLSRESRKRTPAPKGIEMALAYTDVSLLNIPEVLTLRYLAGQRSEELISELLGVLGLRTLNELELMLRQKKDIA
jgi:hypothetical protein